MRARTEISTVSSGRRGIRNFPRGLLRTVFVLICGLIAGQTTARAAALRNPDPPQAAPQITKPIDARYSPIGTGVRPEVASAQDLGPVSNDYVLEHLLLLLHRPAESERALDAFMAEQTNPKSPYYHHWLTATEVGQYGPAQSDIDTIVSWLQSSGFTLNKVHADRMSVDFSGNAGLVRAAFRTEIHRFNVGGAIHVANIGVPQIPSALAPATNRIRSLDDFGLSPWSKHLGSLADSKARALSGIHPKTTCPPGDAHCNGNLIGPQDVAVIYNIKPLLDQGNKGAGQTIAVFSIEVPPSESDYTAYRTRYGLPANNFHFITPGCTVPSSPAGFVLGDISELEAAGAVAPEATLELISCGDASGGFYTAMQNANSLEDSARIWIVPWSSCEAAGGSTDFASVFQTASARGVSVFAPTGDNGAAGCSGYQLGSGIGVSGVASTPFNVAVGGSGIAKGAFGSLSYATSYVGETPWNDHASEVAPDAGSGGPSGCATGSPDAATPYTVSGTCAGYPKPSWQAGLLGNPSDGVRDIPDVSLDAGDGISSYAWAMECTLSTAAADCTPAGGNPQVIALGGTEVSAALMAGIQALINQYTASAQGNPNPTYYSLAAAAYGASGNAACDSSQGSGVSSSCVFYDISQGDNVVACSGSIDCYAGKLSTSSTSYVPAYPATTGWDFASGIGSVNAANLASAWPSAYWIGGSVSGLNSSGLVLALTWSSQTLSIASTAGSYQFVTEAPTSAPYTVTVQSQPTGQTCTVGNASGTVGSTNVSDVDVSCTTNAYSVSYGTDGNGTISGDAAQTVSYGASGSAVTAVPNTGYHFVQWSDGMTSNPRTDTNVQADINVSASFAINTYTLTYSAGANGTVTGSSPQTVNFGASGTAVTAVPNTQYHFVEWSDGVTANPRTDIDVASDVTATAAFAPNVLVFTVGPGTVLQGDTLGVIQITEQDGSGHAMLDSATVDFTISTCGGAQDLGSAVMTNGIATLQTVTRFYTAPVSGLTISASVTNPTPTPVQAVASGTFNVGRNSDMVFNGGFEACRL